MVNFYRKIFGSKLQCQMFCVASIGVMRIQLVITSANSLTPENQLFVSLYFESILSRLLNLTDRGRVLTWFKLEKA